MLTSLLVKERAISKSDDFLNNQDKKHLVNWSNLHQKKTANNRLSFLHVVPLK